MEVQTTSISGLPPLQTRRASSPFDKSSADIILRSSDLVDFHVRRHILFEASPVFEAILSIPQSPSPDANNFNFPPVVDLTEDHKTLDTLLRISYPIVKPKSKRTLQELELAINASQKYEMELPLDVLTKELLVAAKHSSLQVWAIACRTGLEQVAQHAARETLGHTVLDVQCLGRMEGITAGNYYRLLQFRQPGRPLGASTQYQFLSPPSQQDAVQRPVDMPHESFLDIPFQNVTFRSSDGADFRIHKVFVSACSPVLRDKIAASSDVGLNGGLADAHEPPAPHPQDDATDISSAEQPAVLQLDEPSEVLAPFFRSLYPCAPRPPSDPIRFVGVVAAWKKYEVSVFSGDELRRLWGELARPAPLRAYFAAIIGKLDDYARDAAEHTLAARLDGLYDSLMESAPAFAYHSLLQYHRECQASAARLISGVVDKDSQSTQPQSQTGPQPPGTTYSFNSGMANATASKATNPRSKTVWHCSQMDSNNWFRNYVRDLAASAKQRPGQVASTTSVQTVLQKATVDRQWCTSCSPLAENIARLGASLLEIPGAIQQVSLVL